MKADPDFLKFFAGDWQALLEAVDVPGMAGASWDRKAAWLYWELERDSTGYDVFGHAIDPVRRDPAPKPPVGMGLHQRVQMVLDRAGINSNDDAGCLPDPNGISLTFDSAKW